MICPSKRYAKTEIMAFRRAFLLVALWSLAAARCPTVTCDSLSSNVCVQQTGAYAYSVNEDGCDSDYSCEMSAYIALLGTAELTSGSLNTLSCHTTSSSSNDVDWKPVNCEAKQSAKVWSNGGTLLFCQDDSDCLMQDGTWSTCACVPRKDKNGVCVPHSSNTDVFAGYWKNCGLNNVMAEEMAYRYWSFALSNWVYTQSDLSCSDIFSEVDEYASLLDDYESAKGMALAAAMLLFLD